MAESGETSLRSSQDVSLMEAEGVPISELKMKDINHMRDHIIGDIETFKKVPKEDFSRLIESATKYRHSLMRVHEDGQRMVSELKRIGDSDSNHFASNFLKVHELQKKLNEEFDIWQRKLWDDFILPMMNLGSVEREEIQNFEKKTKNALSQLEATAKKAFNDRKKALKKGETEIPQNTHLEEVRAKFMELQKSVTIYKETRYSLWLRTFCAAMDWQRNYHTIASDLLNHEMWQDMMVEEATPLPSPESIVTNPAPIKSERPKSPPPSRPANNPPSEEKKKTKKKMSSRMLARGTFRRKRKDKHENEISQMRGTMGMKEEKNANFVKYYFVLKSEKLFYYKNHDAAEKDKDPIGSFSLYRCSVHPHEGKEKHCFEMQTPPNPVSLLLYFQCSSDKDLEEWMSYLNDSIRLSIELSQLPKEEDKGSETTDKSESVPNTDEMDNGTINSAASVDSNGKDEWIELRMDSGETFYFNQKTQESVWEIPVS